MFRLEFDEPGHQLVELEVGDLGLRFDEIEPVVPPQFLAQLFDFGFYRARHRGVFWIRLGRNVRSTGDRTKAGPTWTVRFRVRPSPRGLLPVRESAGSFPDARQSTQLWPQPGSRQLRQPVSSPRDGRRAAPRARHSD